MVEYNILYGLSLIGVLLSVKKDKERDYLFYTTLLFLIFLVTFREISIGTDTVTYVNYYLYPERGYGRFDQYIEPIYRFLNNTLHLISSDPYFFIITTSLISLIPVGLVINKYSEFKTFSCFLFITAGTMSFMYAFYFCMIRQCIAMSFYLVAIIFYIENNYKINKKIIVCLVLMCLTHISSFIVLLIFFLNKKISFSRRMVNILLIVTLFIGISLIQFSAILAMIFSETLGKGFYFREMSESYEIMRVLPLSLLCFIIYNTTTKRNKRYDFFLKIFTLGALFNNVFAVASNSDRMNLYFVITMILAIPNYVRDKNINKKIRYAVFFSCLFYFSYKFYKVLDIMVDHSLNGIGANIIVPYKSYLY